MQCSVCHKIIEKNYCSACGQYFSGKRVSFKTIFEDLFDSIFSVERSLFTNLKTVLKTPGTLPNNYWNGFRKYYFSPGKFFTIASLFILLHYSIANEFLGLVISSSISSQFVILFTHIFLLTLSSFVIYIRYEKKIFEHLILNIYNISFWMIVFVPISLVLNFVINYNQYEQFFFPVLHLLIITWNSKAFDLTKFQRFVFVTLNLILFYGELLLLVYYFGEF